MAFSAVSGPGKDEGCHGGMDDPSQKKLTSQKGTPPPSPLLSELLKKGSILATNSRLIAEGDGSAGNQTGDVQMALACQPLSQATGAPMLSRLLEAGPSQFSPPLGFMIGTDAAAGSPISAAVSVPVDSNISESAEVGVMVMSVPSKCHLDCPEDKVTELSEDDVTVSYMGDELDLKTVGDIIAIIEDKADEAAEALDAAAVEAALSLCEENGHALSGSWDAGAFQPRETHSTAPAPSSFFHRGLEGATSETTLLSLYNSQDKNLPVSLPPIPSCSSNTSEHCHSAAPPKCQVVTELREKEDPNQSVPADGLSECGSEKHQQISDPVLHENSQTDWEHQQGNDGGNSAMEAECAVETKLGSDMVGSEACEDEDCAEESSSEPDGDVDLEPAASESEDGYSLHTASSSLQLHTTADSIPSSPASSQFSVCSEDLEALQAHKIWKKAIMLVWRAAANHRYANVFLQPVTDEIAPGYHSIVHRPMDLATIKKNIETGLIRTTAEFQRDIMLMFQNAVMYNGLDHDVYHMALEMQRDVLEQIQQFLATQLIMETSESGISAKCLRGRESMRKQDAADKDTVSMSSPAFLLSLFDGGTRGRRSAIEADLKMKK